jgi:glyoxylate carboligase
MDKIASERLADWGVDTVFGLPGDGINGTMEGLRRHQDKVRFVLIHHESARPGSSVMNLCGIMPRIWVKMTRS